MTHVGTEVCEALEPREERVSWREEAGGEEANERDMERHAKVY